MVDIAAGDSKSAFLPPMANAATLPIHERILLSEAGDGRNRAIQLDDQEKIERWKTMFKVASQIEPLELRNKFSEIVESDDGVECLCVQLLNEYRQYRQESEKEKLDLKNEFAKLKSDLDGVNRQNDSRERREIPKITTPPQKQRQAPEDDGDNDDVEDRPSSRERVRAKPSDFSRDQIRFALGGFDRGWGSTQCRPQVTYTCHTLLDVEAHFFGQRPSHGEDIAEVVFGFGSTDNEVISGEIEFPLFISDTRENSKRPRFEYMGNYVAKKLHSIPWERLPEEGKKCATQTVRYRGLPAERSLRKMERDSVEAYIRHQFEVGIYQVPCCRFEFLDFDENLKADIQASRVPQ